MPSKTRTKKKAASKVAVRPKLSNADKIAREIAKREAVFKKASPAEKRVLIAKDVIAQIKAKRIKPKSGTFVQVEKVNIPPALRPTGSLDYYNYSLGLIRSAEGDDADARKLYLENKIQQCSCCALGGMFMSCTLYNNHTTLDGLEYANNDIGEVIDGSSSAQLDNGLNKFFSRAQLRLIEQTFEGDKGVVMSDLHDAGGTYFPDFSPQARAFYRKYRTPKARLIAIMRNIIRNNGTFKP